MLKLKKKHLKTTLLAKIYIKVDNHEGSEKNKIK